MNRGLPTEGPTPEAFPVTNWSAILAARNRSAPEYAERVNHLASLYWRPVYWYIRLDWKHPHEACKDLTQEFFLRLFDQSIFERADPNRGAFRAFLKTILKHFLLEVRRAEGRIKRGGGARPIPIDVVDAPAPEGTPEEAFDAEWARTALDETYRRLAARMSEGGDGRAFEAFKLYYLDGIGPYRDVAQKLGISEFQTQNLLYRARQEMRKVLRELVADSVQSPEALEKELALLMRKEP